MKEYDVIIVGAGPAGSTAASVIARKGLHVLLIDRKRTPGVPKECAEAVGKRCLDVLHIAAEDTWVSNEYDSLLVGMVHGGRVLFKTPRTKGYVLNRNVFDADLATKARTAGAQTLFATAVTSVSIHDRAVVTTTRGCYQSKLLIAADGPQSRIAYQLKLGCIQSFFGFQYELAGRHDPYHTLQTLFNFQDNPGGYYWIFPKKESVNVGIGSADLCGLRGRLDTFIQDAGLSSKKILELNAGLIPGKNKLKKIFSNRALVIGDAAGHTNPLTGGGIPAALHDGTLAGRIAIEAIQANNLSASFLSRYQRLWEKSPFNHAWNAGFSLRKQMERYMRFHSLESVFSKIGFETITGRKGMIRKTMGKGFTLKEALLLYRMTTALFDHILDYGM
jgi:digeranylgeranylglycerophospholipid reductase